ncbi:hypothetical protein MXMO3_03474 (plasmid) [Maritalea myrionectae]|uniref:Uncharacterized protein n=1 Tax=Maritalea myrionectae TaxID=454601 RepID=A0A2R4MIZ3_9HYPH|nr:hypothetical protein [Maritalea myrionectae]AVX05977.1 hypothetical protein MXMO3_03474 [Maritalea myrionectae]
MDNKTVGARIAAVGKDNNKSQKEVAKLLDVSWRAYQTCEVGQGAKLVMHHTLITGQATSLAAKTVRPLFPI